jgi:hypothetical protein
MPKRIYRHPSGVCFVYEVDEEGQLVGNVEITRPGHMAAQEYVLVPAEALQAFALVQKYEERAAGCEDGQSGPLLTPMRPRWNEFAKLLLEELECASARSYEPCDYDLGAVFDKPTRTILTTHFPEVDIDGTLGFFIECDCCCGHEVLRDIAEPWAGLNKKSEGNP